MSCLSCGNAVAPQRPYCGVCIVAMRAEIEQGLLELDDYLAKWAAFAAWCEEADEEREVSPAAKERCRSDRSPLGHARPAPGSSPDQVHEQYRELAHRVTDGLEVVLFWHQVTDELLVWVSDERTGAHYEVAAAPEKALDVFHHPYAYAASMGLPYEEASLQPKGADHVCP
jgi:hypothetical protein